MSKNASRYVNIQLGIQVRDASGLGLTPSESGPFIWVFLSRHLDPCANVKLVPLLDTSGRKFEYQTVTLQGVPEKSIISSVYSCISFQLMCHIKICDDKTKKNLGYERYEPIGGNCIYFLDVYHSHKEPFLLELRDRSCDAERSNEYAKPRVTIQVKVLGLAINDIGFDMEDRDARKIRSENIKLMDNITERFLDTYRKKLKPTVPEAKSMHIPKYVTNISGLNLPASSFIFAPESEKCTDEHAINYMLYAIEIITSLNGWNDTMLYGALKKQFDSDDTRCSDEYILSCKFIGEAFCLFSNCCDYISDLSGMIDVERFINIIWTLAGDCEDLANLPAVIHQKIYKSKRKYNPSNFASLNEREKKASLLASWCRLYIFPDVTAIATLPSMHKQGENIAANGENSICHIYGLGIPRVHFCHWLHESIRQQAIEGYKHDQAEFQWENGIDMTCLVLEGTNFSYSIQVPLHLLLNSKENRNKASIGLRQLINTRNSIEKQYQALAKFGILTPQDNTSIDGIYSITEQQFSPFYRRIVDMWTWNLLHWGINITDLSVGYGDQRSGTRKSGYAVDFRDIVSLSPNVTLLPTFIIDDRELEIIMNTVMQELPFSLEWTFTSKMDVNTNKDKLLRHFFSVSHSFEELYRLATQFKGKLDKLEKSRLSPTPIPPFISYRLNHIKKFNDGMTEAIRELLENNIIQTIKVDVHPITSNGDGLTELYLIDVRLYP